MQKYVSIKIIKEYYGGKNTHSIDKSYLLSNGVDAAVF